MPVSLARRDLLALLIAAAAAVAGMVVWNHGAVDLGLRLTESDGRVYVSDVAPEGNAARLYWWPQAPLLDLTTIGGGSVERAEPVRASWGETFRPPIEAVDQVWIETAVAGEYDEEFGDVFVITSIDRGWLESALRESIWIAALGVAVGILLWRGLAHGLAGAAGRHHAVLLGAAAATPFVLVPVVHAGTPIGIAAGFLVPTALALLVGVSLARLHPDGQWQRTATVAAALAAGLVALLVARYLTPGTSPLGDGARGPIFLLIGATAVAPALIAALAVRSYREWASLMSLGLMPAVAVMAIWPASPDRFLPGLLLALVLVSQLVPFDRLAGAARRTLGRVRSPGSAAPPPAAQSAPVRDVATYALLGAATLAGLLPQYSTWTVMLGVGLAVLVVAAIRGGFMGSEWADAAVPLAAAVAVPVMLAGYSMYGYHNPLGTVASSLAALSVAHVVADRHTDSMLRSRLLTASIVLTAAIILLTMVAAAEPLLLVALVAFIPGVPVAVANDGGEPRAVSSRLETLAIASAPAMGITALVPGMNGVPLVAWLLALLVWRRFTLTPLLRIAQRTQLQRDLAVAAAETERARLAADLHDDALQQLTMLVRKLDEAGQADAAAEAREVAAKLRAVVGDLRLPILDDLGAGAALEWLVERVAPLAGGPVKLDRSDDARPPADVELAVFRVAQEALTNAIKHGRPPIAVRYDVRGDGRMTLAIDDAGPGIGAQAAEEAPGQGHFGLANMQQRAEQIGALLDVRQWPAGGTRVALEWRPQ